MMGRLALAAFSVGVAAVHTQTQLPSGAWLWGIGSFAVLCSVAAALATRVCMKSAASLVTATTRQPQAFLILCVVSAALSLGFMYASLRAQWRFDDALACHHQGHVTRLNIRVVGLPTGNAQARRFDVEQVEDQAVHGDSQSRTQTSISTPKGIPSRLRVTWRAPFGGHRAVPEVMPGQVWRMALKLRRPHAALNPNAVDWEGRLFAQGVRALGSVQGRASLIADQPWASPSIAIERLRYVLRVRLTHAFSGLPSGSILIALALGDQSGIDRKDWQMFNRAGITHLVAISGLHVGLVAGLAAWVAGWVYRRIRWRGQWATERLPAQIVMATIGLFAALVYCALAGWGIPARRVFVMLMVGAGGVFLRQPYCASRTLLLAAGLVTIMDPWAPVAMGFWLSFAAVGVLMMIAVAASGESDGGRKGKGRDGVGGGDAVITHTARMGDMERAVDVKRSVVGLKTLYRLFGRDRPAHSDSSPDDLLFEDVVAPSRSEQWRARADRWRVRLNAAARLQWLLTLALVPLLAVGVGQISFVSPLANAVAIPVVGLLVTPLALACALLSLLPFTTMLTSQLGGLADAIVWPVLQAVGWLAALPWAVWHVASPPWWLAALACVGVAWGLMPPGAPGRVLGWALLLPMLIWRPTALPVGAWSLVALDVGQAGAAVVLTRDHVVVFDVGLRLDNGEDAGMRVVGPYLWSIGRHHVDRLVVSHQHLDHMGGVRGLMAHVSVEQAYAPFDLNAHLMQEAKHLYQSVLPRGWPLSHSPCEAGTRWTYDGVRFRFVHPPVGSHYTPAQANASSCVLVVEGAFHSAVLPADIEAPQERDIVAADEIGRVDLALVSHHGSSTSSIPAWIATLAPSHVIAQSGYANRFGHPTPAVAQRWINSGAWFWRTDLDAAVVANSDAHGLVVESVRDRRRRYWHEALGSDGYEACSFRGDTKILCRRK